MGHARQRTLVAAAACSIVAIAGLAGAQPAPMPIDTLLAMPASPGSIGLLVEHTAVPAARERILAALKDGRAETRAAAARVAFVRRMVDLRPAILEALGAEQDGAAGRELLRAAVGLAPAADLPRLVESAGRLGEGAPLVLAEQLGRSLKEGTVSALPALAPLELPSTAWRLLLRESVPLGTDPIDPIGRIALAQRDARLWYEFLLMAREEGRPVEGVLLAEGLRSGNPDFGRPAAWYIVIRRAKDDAHSLKDAVAEALSHDAHDPELSAVLELASRALGAAPTASKAVLEYLRAKLPGVRKPVPLKDCRVWQQRDLLTDSERKAAEHKWCENESTGDRRHRLAAGSLRTISGLPAGLFRGVLETAGCTAKQSGMMGGRVRARPDGSAAQVMVAPDAASGGCGSALRALLALTLVPQMRLVTEDPTTVLVPTDPALVACSDEASNQQLAASHVVYAQPRQLSTLAEALDLDVGPRPLEPREVVDARVLDLVRALDSVPPASASSSLTSRLELHMLISASGCTASVQIAEAVPVGPRVFATVALKLAERFEPAKRRGRPVPVETWWYWSRSR